MSDGLRPWCYTPADAPTVRRPLLEEAQEFLAQTPDAQVPADERSVERRKLEWLERHPLQVFEQPAAVERLGLSLDAYRAVVPEQVDPRHHSDEFIVSMAPGAAIITCRPAKRALGPRTNAGGRRGAVKRFSAASRLRFLKLCSKFERKIISDGLFITLTYPDAYPSCKDAKRNFEAFVKRLLRKYPSAAGVWRIELQERGAPHFHLIIMGVSRIDKNWLSETWAEIYAKHQKVKAALRRYVVDYRAGLVLGPLSYEQNEFRKHLEVGTQVEKVQSHKGAMSYASKYAAKSKVAEPDDMGRRWGTFGDIDKCLAPVLLFSLRRSQVARLFRVLDAARLAQARKIKDARRRAWAIGKAKQRSWSRVVRADFWFLPPDVYCDRLDEIVGVSGDNTPQG